MSNLLYNGINIQADGTYVNALQLTKATGKDGNEWLSSKATAELIWALALKEGLTTEDYQTGNYRNDAKSMVSAVKNNEYWGLIKVVRGGNKPGTWVHPSLAVHLAMWCNPKFGLMVSDWVMELMTTGSVTLHPAKSGGASRKHLMQFPNFESEDILQEALFSFVSGVCGHRYLEREPVMPNVTNDKSKTRRLDFACFYPRSITAIEIKNCVITPAHISDTFGNKGYYANFAEYVNKRTITNRNKHLRPIKFLLLSTHELTNETKQILDLMPKIHFMTTHDYCCNFYRSALAKKYYDSQWYLNDLVINKYNGLFKPEFINQLMYNNKVRSIAS